MSGGGWIRPSGVMVAADVPGGTTDIRVRYPDGRELPLADAVRPTLTTDKENTMIRTLDDEIDARKKAQKTASTATQIRILALHQVAEHLPFGFVCLCGAELADLNAQLDDARIGGRQLAIAVHQAQELEASTEESPDA